MKAVRIILRILIPLAVIGVAVLGARHLIRTKPKPQRRDQGEMMTMVETVSLQATSVQALVDAMGTVVPSQRIRVQPEVTGLVVWKNPGLVPGGEMKQGDPLLRIDPRNYEAALEQQRSAVQSASLAYELEKSRKAVAEQEWELLNPADVTAESRSLALRDPQLRAAEAALAAARSALQRVELDLARCEIKAPFDCAVVDEFVDIGQLVSPQTTIADLAGTSTYWVRAAVRVTDLAWMPLPDAEGRNGAVARITQKTGDGTLAELKGTVIRLLPDLEPAGRMARVLIEVPDPRAHGKPPLLIGAYVEIEIAGVPLQDVFALPPECVHEGDEVWVMNKDDGRLDIRSVQVLRRQSGLVLVRNGLTAGEKIVTTRIPVPIPGMLLKQKQTGETQMKDADS